MRQPAIYLPHGGGPCFFMDWTMGPADTWDRMAAWLRALPGALPERPRALLVISAHWEQPAFTVLSGPHPQLYFDYYGFPQHTYQLRWPAPGDPALARRVMGMIADAGLPVAEDQHRGYDHGVFVPLKVAFPAAELPVVQVSLRQGLDPAQHMALGRALAPLRDEGVLILGSGMSFHNMRAFGHPDALAPSEAFDRWLDAALAAPEGRAERIAGWAAAPSGRFSHPREEHLIPLHVIAGAGAEEPAKRIFSDVVMGTRVSAWQLG
jgi:aromatic ring-opening dioxygenase catalytic subunit (LigB family)